MVKTSRNEKLWRTISKLDRQSDKEKSGRARVKPGEEMLAITADTGMFFHILLKAIKAKRVLEVGTSTGFSTLWLADAVGKSGRVVTIENDPLKIARAKKNFQDAGVDKIIEVRQGIALDVLHKLKGRFDFVLLDADKENIIKYFNLVLPLVRIGGIIAADNMLFPPPYRRTMKKYAHHVQNHPQVQSVTVPIGMGEEITIKLR
ncbi:O-methyltransferase [Nitrososphaera viennensis]|uniref:O-methyltransferase n=2 Tax=Nitrososphaera viennensis TaxID=1034015 RepID=A0A977ICE4_9ARCH|nr:O-methyltransferase [Nitrososphaera viennensis]AIC16385.1 putative O-methyltransferase [Nitrososphaera viennensis EN76]UVS68320.1 O-methyltransferase [Nitrososphaera viennensis]